MERDAVCLACNSINSPDHDCRGVAQRMVDEFNRYHPVGTPVRFWAGDRQGPGEESRTMTSARLLGGHTPVVWLADASSCIALTHIEVLW